MAQSTQGVNAKTDVGANSFLLEQTPFQEKGKMVWTEFPQLKVYSFPLIIVHSL